MTKIALALEFGANASSAIVNRSERIYIFTRQQRFISFLIIFLVFAEHFYLYVFKNQKLFKWKQDWSVPTNFYFLENKLC